MRYAASLRGAPPLKVAAHAPLPTDALTRRFRLHVMGVASFKALLTVVIGKVTFRDLVLEMFGFGFFEPWPPWLLRDFERVALHRQGSSTMGILVVYPP